MGTRVLSEIKPNHLMSTSKLSCMPMKMLRSRPRSRLLLEQEDDCKQNGLHLIAPMLIYCPKSAANASSTWVTNQHDPQNVVNTSQYYLSACSSSLVPPDEHRRKSTHC